MKNIFRIIKFYFSNPFPFYKKYHFSGQMFLDEIYVFNYSVLTTLPRYKAEPIIKSTFENDKKIFKVRSDFHSKCTTKESFESLMGFDNTMSGWLETSIRLNFLLYGYSNDILFKSAQLKGFPEYKTEQRHNLIDKILTNEK